MVNKYIIRSRLSESKTREIIRYFSHDIEAIKISEMTGISRITINKIFKSLRARISEICDRDSIFENGCVEIDESYFGARRVRGIRGRGARGKHIVFGLIKRDGKVYTQMVENCSAQELYPIIKQHVDQDATIFSDGFRTYDGLVDFGYRKHYRVKHGENEFANGISHINGTENFWGLAKTRLAKFKGISKNTFYLHLKECEFRFNFRKHDIYGFLLKELINKPLKLWSNQT